MSILAVQTKKSFCIDAIAEMIAIGKFVTLPAVHPARLGHFAVLAVHIGASRHNALLKPRTMIFTKAMPQA
jgi:hypothetical protein